MDESAAKAAKLEPFDYSPGHTRSWNEWFERLLELFGDAIISFARSRGLNEHSAEDVLQEVMTTLVRAQHGEVAGYKGKGNFQQWLWQVIRHRVQSVRRGLGKEILQVPLEASPDGESNNKDFPQLVESAHDHEGDDERRWQFAIYQSAMLKVRESMKEKGHFDIFQELFNERSNPTELAERMGMEREEIDIIKHRCKQKVIKEANRMLSEWQKMENQAIP